MKIRSGFVSNSSSSSFTCDVCHHTEEVYDGGGEWHCCENGHSICSDHKLVNVRISTKKMREILIKDVEDNWEKDKAMTEILRLEELNNSDIKDEYDGLMEEMYGDDLPSDKCPVCSFKIPLYNDVENYLLETLGKTEDQIFKEIQEKFPNREAFLTFIKYN